MNTEYSECYDENMLKIYIDELESENRALCDRVSQLNNENTYLKRINCSLADSHERLEKIISGLHKLVDEKDRIIVTQKNDLARFGGIISRMRSIKKSVGKAREKGMKKVNEKKMSR